MRLTRLYPLRGVPNQTQIWSWISFDVANQSFTLLINTLLFSLFFQQVVVRDPNRDDQLWSATYAASMILVVLASPIAGAVADARQWRKAALLLTGFGCAALTCLLGLIQPGQLALAVALYIPANFLFNLGENFLASFLPQLARRQDFGRVSGFSWGVAYSAALFMLVVVAGVMLGAGLKNPDQWRPFFIAAGVWFFLFAIPTLLVLRERPAADAARESSSIASAMLDGARRLARTARQVRQFRDLATLLTASFFYGGAMSVIVAFASIIAQDFGFKATDLVIFVAVITVSGILGTLLPTLLQDRVGHKRTTLILLALWLGTALFMAGLAWMHHAPAPTDPPPARWPVWLAGNLIGFGLGALGSANRAFVGFLTPPDRAGEFFGLWGLVFKLSAILTIPFGVVKDRLGLPASMLVLVAMLVVGALLTLLINERRGAAAAAPA